MIGIDLSQLSIDDLERLQRLIQDELARRRNSNLKPGDRVRHRNVSFPGVGTISEISRSGKMAVVRYEGYFGPAWGRYYVDKLQRVDDAC